MEHLDFGYGLAIIIFMLYGFVYYSIAIVNYILTFTLGELLKKLTDRIFISKKKNILFLALPYFLAAIIIYWTIIQLSFIPLKQTHNQYNAVGGVLFWTPYRFYLMGFVGYIIGQTCLAMTRYSFSNNFEFIGRLKKGRTISNLLIWITINLIITILSKTLFDLYSQFILIIFTYSVLTIFTIFLLLKWRNTSLISK